MALTLLARVMLRNFPRKGDFVSRYARDEIASILQDTAAKEGMVLAERLVIGTYNSYSIELIKRWSSQYL